MHRVLSAVNIRQINRHGKILQLTTTHNAASSLSTTRKFHVKWNSKIEAGVTYHNTRYFSMSRFMKTDVKTNRLSSEKSPYLQQHATNPVNWYPWGPEAFALAKKENKPIFLSVGYSTCHWCHVMERESFCDAEVGDILNQHFVSIKVDREERPDVDKMYMTFVQATSGSGGWPMSVWLTPDLKPIVGGTYFPPDNRFGRPGLKDILMNLANKWKDDEAMLVSQGTQVMDALNRAMIIEAPEDACGIPCKDTVQQKCYQSLLEAYDTKMAGFGTSPKFPQPVKLNMLFSYTYWSDPQCELGMKARTMALRTLDKMADGGIHDHVAKGFHRYSVDSEWHLPHFEKMLYDQGQLATSYLDAYQVTKNEKYADVAKGIFEYVSRDLSDKFGGFYSAEDADSYPTSDSSKKLEGAFCVWTHEELTSVLNHRVEGLEDVMWYDIFNRHYNVKKEGNVDPVLDHHNELHLQNVLKVTHSVEHTAEYFSLTPEATEEVLHKCREVLYDVRQKRPKPHLDSKMLTSWNGLMLSGYARGGQILNDSSLTVRAIDAAEYLHSHMYNTQSKTLYRSSYVGEKPAQSDSTIDGFADDYAFLIRGLLDLYDTCFDERWLEWAAELQATQDKLFWDERAGGYYNTSAKDPSILLRIKEDQDGAEPSANSISTCNLVRLAVFLDQPALRDRACQLVATFSRHLMEVPDRLPQMVCGLMCLHTPPQEIVLIGTRDDPDLQELLDCVRSLYLPNKVMILLHPDRHGKPETYLMKHNKFLGSFKQLDNQATAYVCQDYACSLPVTSAGSLREILTDRPRKS